MALRALVAWAILLLLGLLLGASMLVYSAYVLVAVYLLTRWLSSRWVNGLRSNRKLAADEIEIGQSVQISVEIENRDKWSIVWLLLEDVLSNPAIYHPSPGLKLEGSNLKLIAINGKQKRAWAYRLTALRRGYYQIGPLIAETGDLFGLHRRFRTIQRPTYLLVLPKIIPLHGYELASPRPVGEVRVMYRLMEDPTLVSGIRQYQHGDSQRSIHWRATARTGQLQCKQYQPTSVAGVTLVLDLHRESNPDRHEPLRSDLAITAAASIAHTLLQMHQPFGLISNGRDAIDRVSDVSLQEFSTRETAQRESSMLTRSDRLRPVYVATDRGPEHFHLLARTLARLERTDGLKLPELIEESRSRLPRSTTVLVIVQEVDEQAAMAISMLRRQGYFVAAIVNNYENDTYERAVGHLMAYRIPVKRLVDEASITEICKSMLE